MPDWLSEPGDTLVAIIRQIARDEATRVYVEIHQAREGKDGLQAGVEAAKAVGVCGAVDENNFVCSKPPHKGRHLYRVRPHVAPVRPWEPITEVVIESGTRKYTLTTDKHPVKVKGLGKGGAAGDGWYVISMERHTETGKVNVEVIKEGKNQRSRTVELSRIVYKRPRKGV